MIHLVIENATAFIAGAVIGGLSTFVPFVIWVAIGSSEEKESER